MVTCNLISQPPHPETMKNLLHDPGFPGLAWGPYDENRLVSEVDREYKYRQKIPSPLKFPGNNVNLVYYGVTVKLTVIEGKKMLKKIDAFLLVVLFFCLGPLRAEKIAVFKDFVKPDMYLIDDGRLYVTEDAVIFIYSLQDFKLQKKFGRQGEGPGEFFINWSRANDMIVISTANNQLIVNSWGKLSYFAKDGKYLRERRIPANVGQWFNCLGERFVGRKYIREKDGLQYHGIVLYDADFNKVRFVYKHVHGVQWRLKKPFNPLTVDQAFFEIADNKIFVIDGARTAVRIFDQEGKKLFTAANPDKPVVFNEQDKKEKIASYKYNKTWKRIYETRKPLFRWPSYWPPLRWFFLDPADKKIYLQTYEAREDKLKYIVYDFSGRFLNKCLLPYRGRMLFNGGRFYQLLENEENETWELYVKDAR